MRRPTRRVRRRSPEELERLSWQTAPTDEELADKRNHQGVVDSMPPEIRAICHERGYWQAMAYWRANIRQFTKKPRRTGAPAYVAPRIEMP